VVIVDGKGQIRRYDPEAKLSTRGENEWVSEESGSGGEGILRIDDRRKRIENPTVEVISDRTFALQTSR